MEKWKEDSSRYRNQHRQRDHDHNPSFSSTLLDEIYRSIDESHLYHDRQGGAQELVLYKETTMKKKTTKQYITSVLSNQEHIPNFQRIEKWMEEKKEISNNEKITAHKKSGNQEKKYFQAHNLLNSSWSSSDSSSGDLFSSGADSNYGVSSKSSYSNFRPKPKPKTKPNEEKKQEGSTKSKALKIYADLKKVKQPISPGGKLARFLNSIFTTGNAKKAKISSSGGYEDAMGRKSKSAHASTCSSASSFSRSCLSKTPSSRGKSSGNATKRSVRFYPVSVIVDEDCRPCGHKSLQEYGHGRQNMAAVARNSVSEELSYHIREKNRRAAMELLKNYQRKVECKMDEEDDDDDDASYASSDLFELDNLSAIGIERYREELPVYETTYFDTNRPIANGLIV